MTTTQQDLASGEWTVNTLKAYTEAVDAADKRFLAERDRRYTEVNIEREKALKIKETADLAALQLAREIQTYKDEKANDLRSQIERERGTYATQGDLKGVIDKIEATLAPIAAFVSRQQGRTASTLDWRTVILALIVVAAALAGPHIK